MNRGGRRGTQRKNGRLDSFLCVPPRPPRLFCNVNQSYTPPRGFRPDEPAFEGIALERSALGIPVLHNALGYLECEPTGSIDWGDHHIFLARVIGGSLSLDEKPMVHVRKNGMRY